jgi:hypothetical protein
MLFITGLINRWCYAYCSAWYCLNMYACMAWHVYLTTTWGQCMLYSSRSATGSRHKVWLARKRRKYGDYRDRHSQVRIPLQPKIRLRREDLFTKHWKARPATQGFLHHAWQKQVSEQNYQTKEQVHRKMLGPGHRRHRFHGEIFVRLV